MIIDRYIIRKLIGPFAFGSFTIMFVFLLQFLMKTADNLIGKGLSADIIIKLIVYNLAWMLVLAIPMGALGMVLMAYGSLTQDNEFTILKSSGVSLIRLMVPAFIVGTLLCVFLIWFNNAVLPETNYKAKTLMYDISRTKPTLKLEANVFSNQIPNYSIMARRVSKTTNEIYDVLIYDYTNPFNINIITAKKANIYFTPDNKKMLFDMEDGVIHQEVSGTNQSYRRIYFRKHKIALDASQFTFEQSGPGLPRGDRELSAGDMQKIVDSLSVLKTEVINEFRTNIKSFNQNIFGDFETTSNPATASPSRNPNYFALNSARSFLTNVMNFDSRIEYFESEIYKYEVEIHKKYAIPFACIVFVLVGAPLGVLTRKGSFGVAASISLFFFLVYWICLIGGEKLADRRLLNPFLGMWMANFIIGALGIFLTYRMNKEQIMIDFSFLKKYLPKSFFPPTEENVYQ
ncbi:MAG: LptF/LptG family permease [Ignavibacteria bacterium]|nr:YjgP/YjgQ family permease [Ignavibacteria bacterium]